MPKIHYENAGEVLKHEFLRGVIQTVDSETDTCTVEVSGRTVDALLFYHCEPESVIRDNGAITGAAAGFAEGDAVIVQTNRDDPTEYLVVAHLDGVKKCAKQCVLFYIRTMAVVWDCKNNKVFDVPGVTFPCLKTNAAFGEWLATKESDETAHTLFNLNNESGNYAGNGATTVGCPQLCDENDEYEYVDGIVYVGYCDYWDAYAGTMTRYDLTHSCRNLTFEIGLNSKYRTAYGLNLLPGGSGFVGVRTSYERSIITSLDMPFDANPEEYGTTVDVDAAWNDPYHSTTILQYYGILESVILYEFEGSEDWPAEFARSDYGWPFMSTSRVLTNTAPPWAVGQYSDKVIAFCTIMQTIPATHIRGDTNGCYASGGVVNEYTYDERVIKIQAVASFFEGGTTGKQYKAFASNAALNAKLIQAAEMYYTLNNIPATTVEWIIPEIRILK